MAQACMPIIEKSIGIGPAVAQGGSHGYQLILRNVFTRSKKTRYAAHTAKIGENVTDCELKICC